MKKKIGLTIFFVCVNYLQFVIDRYGGNRIFKRPADDRSC
jgi:hypothetical protein